MKRDWMCVGFLMFLNLCVIVSQAAQPADVKTEWVERIKSAPNHKVMAFQLGPELVKVAPETGVIIAEAVWPQIKIQGVKTGLLKAFAFGKHPLVLRVLHLGMTDPDPEVRRYAETYLRPLAMRTFDGNAAAYQAWYKENGSKPIDALRSIGDNRLPETTETLLKKLQEEYPKRKVWDYARALAEIGDPRTIPTMIGVIDADNSYDTIYGVGYFGLGCAKMREVTGVNYSAYHDGAWWRRWWAANKVQFPKEVQGIPIPDLPKTENGKKHVPFPAELDTLDGKLKRLRKMFEKGQLRELSGLAGEIGDQKDPKAIPLMIGIIDADNSYDTVYGVGYFGLGFITGVRYSEFHDGAWWRRWWAANKKNYPADVRALTIPDLPKTENGKEHVPYPENLDTFEGRTAYLAQMIRKGKLSETTGMWGIAQAYAEAGDPRAIPVLIGVIAANNKYETVYGVGAFGLNKLTGVPYDAKHDGAWWRQWWTENKSKYPEAAKKLEIPDFAKEVREGQTKAKLAEAAAATADVADIPSMDIKINGDSNKRYFLIGPTAGAKPPREGYKLAIIMPGGDGGENFNPFVRRIYKNALGTDWIAAQPVAFKWTPVQQIVWPTKTQPALGQQFATEDFIEAIVADVKAHHPVNAKEIVTLSWSSSGPAAYATSLQERKSVTGSYVAMSVFRPEWFPPLSNAKGHKYFIDHSPQDQICPFAQAQAAREQLVKAGAKVESVDYEGGHGWHGDVYGRIRKGMAWLTSN